MQIWIVPSQPRIDHPQCMLKTTFWRTTRGGWLFYLSIFFSYPVHLLSVPSPPSLQASIPFPFPLQWLHFIMSSCMAALMMGARDTCCKMIMMWVLNLWQVGACLRRMIPSLPAWWRWTSHHLWLRTSWWKSTLGSPLLLLLRSSLPIIAQYNKKEWMNGTDWHTLKWMLGPTFLLIFNFNYVHTMHYTSKRYSRFWTCSCKWIHHFLSHHLYRHL